MPKKVKSKYKPSPGAVKRSGTKSGDKTQKEFADLGWYIKKTGSSSGAGRVRGLAKKHGKSAVLRSMGAKDHVSYKKRAQSRKGKRRDHETEN